MKDQSGQTAVEYLLMLVVVVAMMISVLNLLKSYLLAEEGDCEGPKAEKSVICQVKRVWRADQGFRTFTLYNAPKD